MFPSTFSIAAVDLTTGEIGVGVQSKFLSVGAIVPFVRAGIGAIATQAFANTSYGPRGLDLLAAGRTPDAVVAALSESDDARDHRQFGVVAADGRSASYTGAKCIDYAHGICGPGFAAQGNCLAGPAVVEALASTFADTRGSLADRLVAALRAAQTQGGDKRGQQSAGLVIEKPGAGYGGFNDRYVDLRIDDHAAPIEELARLLEMHKLYYFPAEPADVLEIDRALGAELVRELQRVGFLSRDVSTYDGVAAAGLVSFMHNENLENRVRDDGGIDRQTLGYLRSAPEKLHS